VSEFLSFNFIRPREGGREGRKTYLHCSIGRVKPAEQLLVSKHDVGLQQIFVEGVDARANA